MPSRILIVEGRDDDHAISHMCAKHGIDFRGDATEVHVQDSGGFESLRRNLEFQLGAADLRRAAIVVDANGLDASGSAVGRWQSLRDRLRDLGFADVPDAALREGTVVTKDDGFQVLTVVVWIMPDNSSPGMLEDFLLNLVPGNDRFLPLAEAYVDGIPDDPAKFSNNHKIKAVRTGQEISVV